MKSSEQIWIEVLRLLARPFARFCLRRSLRIQDALEALKIAFVEEAKQEIEDVGHEANLSRISVVTGLHRRDVTRIAARGETKNEPQGMLTRLIGQWQHDSRFTTKRGLPRILTYQGDDSEFSRLVRLVSLDLKPATVLFELERSGAIEHTPRGIGLTRRAVSTHGETLPTMRLLSRDLGDFIHGVEQNALAERAVPNLHARTYYDRIVASAEEPIRNWLMDQGADFHRRARTFFSQYDLDVNPGLGVENSTIQVSLGTFSLTSSAQPRTGGSDEKSS